MASVDDCLRRVNELLDQAARTTPAERSRLIEEAAHWQIQADAAGADLAAASADPATGRPH